MNLYQNFGGWTLVFAVLVTRRHLRCLRHPAGMASDPLIDFGDALLGPLTVGEGERWATIACRAAVRGPRWAFPPRLPGGPTVAGLFCI
jgi:hypothetical protein